MYASASRGSSNVQGQSIGSESSFVVIFGNEPVSVVRTAWHRLGTVTRWMWSHGAVFMRVHDGYSHTMDVFFDIY